MQKQNKLLLSLTNGEQKNVMMVGDPNQSIFHFTGSSSLYMSQKFKEDFLPKEFKLNENYRSSKKVLEVANEILPNTIDTSNVILEGEFILEACEDEFIEAKWIIEKIKELIERKNDSDIEGEITYEKIAVLARNKYVFRELENKLREQSLPYLYKMTPGAIVFESEFMKLFDLALRLKLNAQDILHKEQLFKVLKLQFEQNFSLKDIIDRLENSINKDILQIVLNIEEDGSNLVALTRAKRFLYVTYPQKRTMPWGGVKSRNISTFLTIF